LGNELVLSRSSTPGLCERTENRRYSQGAVLNLSGEVARCATVFDGGFKPSGAAWIDATSLYDDFFVARIN
jgi:hypothetical protein